MPKIEVNVCLQVEVTEADGEWQRRASPSITVDTPEHEALNSAAMYGWSSVLPRSTPGPPP